LAVARRSRDVVAVVDLDLDLELDVDVDLDLDLDFDFDFDFDLDLDSRRSARRPASGVCTGFGARRVSASGRVHELPVARVSGCE
jgi:hypothetical protein